MAWGCDWALPAALLSKAASGWRLAASGCVLFGWIYSIWDRSGRLHYPNRYRLRASTVTCDLCCVLSWSPRFGQQAHGGPLGHTTGCPYKKKQHALACQAWQGLPLHVLHSPRGSATARACSLICCWNQLLLVGCKAGHICASLN